MAPISQWKLEGDTVRNVEWWSLQRHTSVSGRSITLMATVMLLDFHFPFHTCLEPPFPTRSTNSKSANSMNGEVIKKGKRG